MGSRALLVVPACVVIAACSASNPMPDPHVSAVEHATYGRYIGDDADRPFTVVGENFSAGVTANASNPDESTAERVFVRIQHESGSLPIDIPGALLSSDRFEGTIPTSVDSELEPGLYDVIFRNADDAEDRNVAAFEMGYKATRLVLFTNTAAEPNFGIQNRITASMRLETDTPGQAGYRKDAILPTLSVSSGAFAQVTQSEEISPESYDQPVYTVIDSKSEAVVIAASGVPADIATESLVLGTPASPFFVPGLPVVVRMVAGDELIPTDDFVETTIQIEDQWANVCDVHQTFVADFSVFTCSNGFVSPDPVTINANDGFAAISVICTNATFATVLFDDVTPVTPGYANGGAAVFDFD